MTTVDPPPSQPGSPRDPEQLFATFRAGHEAFGQLLEVHREHLRKLINGKMPEALKARAGASDVVQDALVGVLTMTSNALFSVRAEEDLEAWLRRVCVNALKKQSRDQRRARRDVRRSRPLPDGLEAGAAGRGPSSEYRLRERDEALEPAIRDLPEADRLLLRLKIDHGWSAIALAGLLEGRPSEAGRVRVQRRLARLLLQLADDPRLRGLAD